MESEAAQFPKPDFGYCLVENVGEVEQLVDLLEQLPLIKPVFYLGIQDTTIMQIFIPLLNCVFLVDILKLGKLAVLTYGSFDVTLKDILESREVHKAVFDARIVSKAIYELLGVKIDGVTDLQLMELASHRFASRRTKSLTDCIEDDVSHSDLAISDPRLVKTERVVPMISVKGRAQTSTIRPIPEMFKLWCVYEMQYLPHLWAIYSSKLNAAWRTRVALASRDRAIFSRHLLDKSMEYQKAGIPIGW